MNKNDFVFYKLDTSFGYEDYWYKVVGETKNELTTKYMEQSMIEVIEVVYSKDEDIVGIKRLFPFNYDAIVVDDAELKCVLKDLCKQYAKE